MMSNDYTFDKTMAISKKIGEIRGLLKELDNDNSTFLTESFDVCNECLELLESEVLPYHQPPMPPLENGMFGIKVSINPYDCSEPRLTPFVVVGDSLIYQSGGYDFADPKLLQYSKIIRLYDVNNFDIVRHCYYKEQNNGVIDKREIWRDNSYRGEYKFYDEDEDDYCIDDEDMED